MTPWEPGSARVNQQQCAAAPRSATYHVLELFRVAVLGEQQNPQRDEGGQEDGFHRDRVLSQQRGERRRVHEEHSEGAVARLFPQEREGKDAGPEDAGRCVRARKST